LPVRSVSMSTLYRALVRAGLDRRSVRSGVVDLSGPTKAFEYSWANQLWMTDVRRGHIVTSNISQCHLVQENCSLAVRLANQEILTE